MSVTAVALALNQVWLNLGAKPAHEAASSGHVALDTDSAVHSLFEGLQSVDLSLCLPIPPGLQHCIANGSRQTEASRTWQNCYE